jgi:hypothetical protein
MRGVPLGREGFVGEIATHPIPENRGGSPKTTRYTPVDLESASPTIKRVLKIRANLSAHIFATERFGYRIGDELRSFDSAPPAVVTGATRLTTSK